MVIWISIDRREISDVHHYLSFPQVIVFSSLARSLAYRSFSGNAVLVALIELMENYRNELLKKDLNPWYFLALLATLEVIVVLIALVWYLGKARERHCRPEMNSLMFGFVSVLTIRFNKQRARPDATQEDLFSTSQMPTNEIGFQWVWSSSLDDLLDLCRTSSSDEKIRENILEKQADLIRYLRERNEQLGRLVLQEKQRLVGNHRT